MENKDWKEQFKQEFGIHFSNSEFSFAINFIESLLKSKQEALTRLVGLYGTPICDHLHHNKKQRHTGCEICPVVKEINDLKPIISNLLK